MIVTSICAPPLTRWARYLVFLLPLPLYAQVSGSSGQVQGTVTDSSGASMAGVGVILRHPGTAATRQTETSADGQFRFSAISIG